VLVGALLAALGWLIWRDNVKKKVFISYDHSEDARYKNLLAAWDANTNFKFEFDNRSPNEAIESTDAGRIKAALTTMMKSAEYLLVIVGSKSHTSKWMTWEIDRAKQPDIKLKLAAVKIDRTYTTPPGLLGVGTAWANAFDRDAIVAALNSATNNY
jgi:antiphage defense system Thoeris ThsB-like protein